MVQLTLQPGDTTLSLNQISNATFYGNCACIDCTSPLFWSLENEGRLFITDNEINTLILAERGVTYSSSDISAVTSIPDTVENNKILIARYGIIWNIYIIWGSVCYFHAHCITCITIIYCVILSQRGCVTCTSVSHISLYLEHICISSL